MREWWIDTSMIDKPCTKYAYTDIQTAEDTAIGNIIHVVSFSDVEHKLNNIYNNYSKNINAVDMKLNEAKEILEKIKLSLGKIDDIT